jgi:hypothetical protein
MNLIEQFPDISAKVRAKIKMDPSNYKAVNARFPSSYYENEAVTKYYAGQFRKWHLKLFFILAVCVSIFYFTLLQGARVLQWITI